MTFLSVFFYWNSCILLNILYYLKKIKIIKIKISTHFSNKDNILLWGMNNNLMLIYNVGILYS